ncbi:MAG: hypothetical protein MJ050_00730 [Phascolarctobacterium sp.]|nr:hypothetical protein [Phascolarctobacterium sp.]
MKKKLSTAPLQVEYICPKCGKHLAWALPIVSMSCPQCGKWVTNENRAKVATEVYIPMDSDQVVLFNLEEN